MCVEVRVLGAAQWRAWRDLRLEGLADTPIGFGELHADALRTSDEDWQAVPHRPGLQLLAWDGDRPVGMAGGFHREDGTPVLYAVFVTPSWRGRGVLDVLIDHVVAWCAPDPLHLDVHEDNHPAHAAYLRRGFVDTGVRTAGGGIDGRDLVGMVRPRSGR